MNNQFMLQVWPTIQDWTDGNSVTKATWNYAHEEIADRIIPIMEEHVKEGSIIHFEIYSMPDGNTYYHSMDDRH